VAAQQRQQLCQLTTGEPDPYVRSLREPAGGVQQNRRLSGPAGEGSGT
jgi:hypothetical protein